jgi:glutamine amidotransferase
MCRLYGFLSNEPTKVECSLVHAQNALLHQSRADSRGEAHSDGWGIVCYREGSPQAERRATAAHEDLWFSMTAERTYSRAVIAHIRKATVGKARLENTHPFTHGYWTFAHNGTVAGFDHIQSELEEQTDRDLLKHRKGSTDSELVFYWLLTRMRRAGLVVDEPCADLLHLVEIVSRSVARLDELSRCAAPNITSKLNLLLTDGRYLLAVRWNHSLFFVEREGVHDCEICGIPHVRHQTGTDYRALDLASEPISHEDWREIPNQTIVTANKAGDVNMYPVTQRNSTFAGGELHLRT